MAVVVVVVVKQLQLLVEDWRADLALEQYSGVTNSGERDEAEASVDNPLVSSARASGLVLKEDSLGRSESHKDVSGQPYSLVSYDVRIEDSVL